MPSAHTTIATNIRRLAADRGHALDALADFAGVSRRQLYSFLGGEKDVTIGWLEKVAAALDVKLIDLLADVSARSAQKLSERRNPTRR